MVNKTTAMLDIAKLTNLNRPKIIVSNVINFNLKKIIKLKQYKYFNGFENFNIYDLNLIRCVEKKWPF